MPEGYKELIARLINEYPLPVDNDLVFDGKPPTMASSEFLTNKEQGDWAEQVVFKAINDNCPDYVAVKYGRSDSLGAGDPGFAQFYRDYQDELNRIGKKPDLLIFRRGDIPEGRVIDADDIDLVSRAVAAIEVRSSSFLEGKYFEYMQERSREAEAECLVLRDMLLDDRYSSALRVNMPEIYAGLRSLENGNIRNFSFRMPPRLNSPLLKEIKTILEKIREHTKLLQRRDYLSITPKLEDLVLVNRWVQVFGVRHFYLQVFFDKAYVISFKDILELSSNPENAGIIYSIEKDTKNQGKTTIKINLNSSKKVIDNIQMPSHISRLKELDRGRLLFYVSFVGDGAELDFDIFNREIINAS